MTAKIIVTATFEKGELYDVQIPGCLEIDGGIQFHSYAPESEQQATEINSAMEDIVGLALLS